MYRLALLASVPSGWLTTVSVSTCEPTYTPSVVSKPITTSRAHASATRTRCRAGHAVSARRAQDVPPLDPGTFARAVIAALSAGEDAGGDAASVDRLEADGSISLLQVPDTPHGRAAFALKRHFAGDETAFHSALPRFRALMDLFARGTLGEWARAGDGGRSALHPAVIDVASRMRLSRNGRFAPRKSLDAVEHGAASQYPELASWRSRD